MLVRALHGLNSGAIFLQLHMKFLYGAVRLSRPLLVISPYPHIQEKVVEKTVDP